MSGLTGKQERAIGALLSEPSIAAAAGQIGVTERTVYRWLEEPAFAEAYRQACQQVVQQALVRVQALTSNAVGVLEAVMVEDSVPPGTRLAAAKVALEYAVKAVELEDLAGRLARLEQMYEERSRLNLVMCPLYLDFTWQKNDQDRLQKRRNGQG